jgi:hypothetical protein
MWLRLFLPRLLRHTRLRQRHRLHLRLRRLIRQQGLFRHRLRFHRLLLNLRLGQRTRPRLRFCRLLPLPGRSIR